MSNPTAPHKTGTGSGYRLGTGSAKGLKESWAAGAAVYVVAFLPLETWFGAEGGAEVSTHLVAVLTLALVFATKLARNFVAEKFGVRLPIGR